MPKKFYTEKDIEELFNSGVTSLKINDDVQLTEMAYEKANRLGLHLLTDGPDTPPSAPVRPYLSGGGTVHSAPTTASVALSSNNPKPDQPSGADLATRIRSAVLARLGNQIDPNLLDKIIVRVLKSTGMK